MDGIRILRASVLAAAIAFVATVSGGTEQVGASEAMVLGGLTSQPIGHFEFCRAYPSECQVRSADLTPLAMSPALMTAVETVNLAVNRSVRAESDLDQFGRDEVWDFPKSGAGDCEDYVLEKRRDLMAEGFSAANLLITVVRKPDGEGHAVLTVRTNAGDFILDNLNDEVKPWDQTGYRFLKRQASNNAGRWVAIRGGQPATMVSAVK